MRKICILFFLFFLSQAVYTQNPSSPILPGACSTESYVPLLRNRSVAVFANQTAVIGNAHLIDSLLSLGIHIKKIFAPEHGFRGSADAGEHVHNQTDPATGIPIISLYGSRQAPSKEDLKDVDILVFDIQDVGVRFYTYISSLQIFLEAAIENNKPLILLDRPNPNGFYVDGPVLIPAFKSFVGQQPVPIVYGMTIGEYASMIMQEKWLGSSANATVDSLKARIKGKADAGSLLEVIPYQQRSSEPDGFKLIVISCGYYDHKSRYILPVKPSPNLPDMQAVYLYPSLCFFEGTKISLGRGTAKPFEVYGHPYFTGTSFQFTPRSTEGAKNPPLLDQRCYGFDLSGFDFPGAGPNRIHLEWLINAYRLYPDKSDFFLASGYFNKLAGTDLLMQQIKQVLPEQEIRSSWQTGLLAFKKIRKKYLIYPDFE